MTAPRTYVVTAATGRIGRPVAEGLLRAGHRVRVLGRDEARLQPLAALGATPLVGSLEDGSFVKRAFDGADAAFLLIPGLRTTRDFRRYFAGVAGNYAEAARSTGLGSALFVSSLGAHDDKHRGLILVHRDGELELNAVAGLHLVHLRAAFFYENLFYFLEPMRKTQAVLAPIAPDARIDMGSTADVARVALSLLSEVPFEGKRAHEVRARQPVSMSEIAELISRALGRPFPAQRMPREANVDALVAAGASWDFAHSMNDAWDSFSRYGLMRDPGASASSAVTTRIDDFVRTQIVPRLGPP